jgi:hypothetical protein
MRTKKLYSFDEKKSAEETLLKGFPNGKIDSGEMSVVAKYFRNIRGLGAVKLERELISFCQSQDPDFNPIIEAHTIKGWIKFALENNLRKVNPITITHNEIETIKTIINLKERKILFAILVLAKALKQGGTRKNKITQTSEKYYIHYNNIPTIIHLSESKITEKEFAKVLRLFRERGLLFYYSPEKELIRLEFVNNDGPVAMTIDVPEKAMEYYRAFFGGDAYYCPNCGKETIKNSNRQEKCDECSRITRKEKEKERLKKFYKNSKNSRI